jgi:hypothetical protein
MTGTAFRFMNLPQEIRDMIYHEIWLNIPAAMRSRKYDEDIRVQYDGMRDTIPAIGLPSWLLTSKAILEQGMAQFKRNAVFSLPRIPGHHETRRVEERDFGPDISPLVDMSTASRLHVEVWGRNVDFFHWICHLGMARPDIQCIVSKFGCNLQVLRITMSQGFSNSGPPSTSESPWRVVLPFSPIARGGAKFRKIEVCLKIYGREETWRFGDGILAALKDEITRHGRLIVGMNGKYSVQDITDYDTRNTASLLKPVAWLASFTRTAEHKGITW